MLSNNLACRFISSALREEQALLIIQTDLAMNPEDIKMSLTEHLDELRSRIIYSLVVVVALAVVAYIFKDQIMAVLVGTLQALAIPKEQVLQLLDACRRLYTEDLSALPVDRITQLKSECARFWSQGGSLIFIHPTEAFFGYLKLSLFVGLLLGAPFVLYQTWRFILPALYRHERRYFLNAFTLGTSLFYIGVFFCFLVVLPLGIRFLIGIGGPHLQASFTFGNYISFVMLFLLVFGLMFELPVIVFLLVKVGLVSRAFLKEKRRHVIVLIFIAAAVLTPTVDPFTQSMMAIPLWLLYEVSIFMARFAEKQSEPERALEGGRA